MKYIYSAIVLLLALFLAAFIQQNGTSVQLKYFYWATPHLPVSLYMILCFAAGYALAVLVGFVSGIRFRLRATGAEREARQLREEVDRLKRDALTEVGTQYQPDTGIKDSGSEENSLSGDGEGESATGGVSDADTTMRVLGSEGEEEK